MGVGAGGGVMDEFDPNALGATESVGILLRAVIRLRSRLPLDLAALADDVVGMVQRWIDGGPAEIDDLYDLIVPIVDEEANVEGHGRYGAHGLLSFVYFALWEMYPERDLDTMPSDIVEVDETYFFGCLEQCSLAAANSPAEVVLQHSDIRDESRRRPS